MNLKITVEPVLFLYMLSTFMLLPAVQDMIYSKVCLQNYAVYVCDSLYAPGNMEALSTVQSVASHWIMASTWMLAIPAMISAPFLGSWSDIYGRKIPLLFPPLGGVFSSLVYIISSVYLTESHVGVILLASFISGILGSFSSCILTCMSYLSEVSSLSSRTWRLSILESMTFIAAALGPFLSGAIQSGFGRASVFTVMMALHSITVVYILVFVNRLQSRPTEQTVSAKNLFSCKRTHEAFRTIVRPRQENRRSFIIILLVVAVITMFASAGERDITFLYLKDAPIKWDVAQYSNYLSLKNTIGAVALLLLRLCSDVSDGFVLCAGLVSKICGMVLFGVAPSSWVIYLTAVVGCLYTWCIIATRASISKLVEADEQGKAFACFAVLENLSGLAAASLFNTLYPATRTFFHGFSFLLAALFLLVALGASCYAHVSMRRLNIYGTLIEPQPVIEEEPNFGPPSFEDNESITSLGTT